MPNVDLPPPIERYFAAKGGGNPEATSACFTEDATVWDNGEDIKLQGTAQIQEWMTGKVAGYKLTSEVKSCEAQGDGIVTSVVVSGDFRGSPYQFDYRFKLRGDKIAELSIDPVGSLAS